MTQALSTAEKNKQLLQHVFTELAAGNTKPYQERLADNIQVTVTGTTRWSRTYAGKQALFDELFRPLFALFADRFTNTAHRMIAEGDYVVVESRGKVTIKGGKPYHNTYCNIFRLVDGKVVEITEYCDTALVNAVL